MRYLPYQLVTKIDSKCLLVLEHFDESAEVPIKPKAPRACAEPKPVTFVAVAFWGALSEMLKKWST